MCACECVTSCKIIFNLVVLQYFGLVIFLFLTEFMFATLAFVFREQLGDTLKDELMLGIREHYMNPPDNGLETIWDHIHNEVSLYIKDSSLYTVLCIDV